MIELAAHGAHGDPRKLTTILTDRLSGREFVDLFSATPDGVEATQRMLIAEAEAFRTNGRSSAADRAALIRIYLLAQIDTLWWGHTRPYATDIDGDRVGPPPNDALPIEFR
jgi:hypothetical protein